MPPRTGRRKPHHGLKLAPALPPSSPLKLVLDHDSSTGRGVASKSHAPRFSFLGSWLHGPTWQVRRVLRSCWRCVVVMAAAEGPLCIWASVLFLLRGRSEQREATQHRRTLGDQPGRMPETRRDDDMAVMAHTGLTAIMTASLAGPPSHHPQGRVSSRPAPNSVSSEGC